MGNLFDRVQARVKEMTPKTGFNVVGVDKFETPGEELYLVGHFALRSDAEKALLQKKKESPGDDYHIYAANS